MVMGTLTGKMGCTPVQPVKVSIKEIKGVTHKNVDVDGAQTSTRASFQNRCHVNGTNSSAVTTDVSEPHSTVMERMTAGDKSDEPSTCRTL